MEGVVSYDEESTVHSATEMSMGTVEGGSGGSGSDNSSTNNDFFLVNEGDILHSNRGSCAAMAQAETTEAAASLSSNRYRNGDKIEVEGNLSAASGGGAAAVDCININSRADLVEKQLMDAALESGEDNNSSNISISLSNHETRSNTDSLNAAATDKEQNSGQQHHQQQEINDNIDLVSLLVGGPGMSEQVDSTYLHGVTYLGCGPVDSSDGYEGALAVMLDLKREAMSAVPVTLVVPASSNGHLRLITPGTEEVHFSVSVRNVACCTRGNLKEIEDCLGFVVSQPCQRAATSNQAFKGGGDDEATSSPDFCVCHVVQFAAIETITAALNSFSQAFGMHSMPPGGLHAILGNEPLLLLQFTISVRENDLKQQSSHNNNITNNSSTSFTNNSEITFPQNVPRDKTCLKLRQSVLKRVEVAIKVVSVPPLPIERTCGFFVQFDDVAANVKNCNYELLDHLDCENRYCNDGSREIVACGILDPNLPQFQVFNYLTGKAGLLFVRFALDVVFLGIESPVRFHLPVVCKVLAKTERFFYPNRKPIITNYIVNLKARPDSENSYSVENLKCEGQSRTSYIGGNILTSSLFGGLGSSDKSELVFDDATAASFDFTRDYYGGSEPDDLNHNPEDENNEDLDDSVLVSGYGSVSKDCSEEVLAKWDEVLKEWKDTSLPVTPPASPISVSFSFGSSLKGRPQPKTVRNLVRTFGIPEALRGEVWQRQVGTDDSEELCVKYRQFLDQEFVNEDQIKRDIHRTFPANDFFKDDQGPGQEALLKLAKAYAQYDQEIGYCQGFTYIAAVLLLHMPEEQAFCVFVRLMGLFKLRELYKQDFYELKLKWYQLDSLVKDNIPTLYYHFQSIGLKSHMFSSQWFLTLYTAKFPLYLVYRIYDIIFSEGLSFLLNVALALLREASDELCGKSFEECNTYIKANIPRKYRDENAADHLITKALHLKINPKKLSLYAKEYYQMIQREERLKDPMERLKVEQQENHSKIMALEAEAVNLANELVNVKMDSQRKLELVDEKVSQIQAMFERTHQELAEMQEQKQSLENEVQQLRKDVKKKSDETNQQKDIVAEYRKLCSRLERERDQQISHVQQLKEIVSKCEKCQDDFNCVFSNDDELRSDNNDELPSANNTIDGNDNSRRLSKFREYSTRGTTQIDRDNYSLEMEQELALTKLTLVEQQSHNQLLEHEIAEMRQMVTAMSSSANHNSSSSSAAAQWLFKRTPSFLSRAGGATTHNTTSNSSGTTNLDNIS